jgi:hypothetical protein
MLSNVEVSVNLVQIATVYQPFNRVLSVPNWVLCLAYFSHGGINADTVSGLDFLIQQIIDGA